MAEEMPVSSDELRYWRVFLETATDLRAHHAQLRGPPGPHANTANLSLAFQRRLLATLDAALAESRKKQELCDGLMVAEMRAAEERAAALAELADLKANLNAHERSRLAVIVERDAALAERNELKLKLGARIAAHDRDGKELLRVAQERDAALAELKAVPRA